MNLFKLARYELWKLRFLIKTSAPLWVIRSAFFLNISHRLSNKFGVLGKVYLRKRKEFKLCKKSLRLDNDWFTGNIPTWLRAFDKEGLREKEKIDCLEIGSWQGLSAFFILRELPSANLICVDTWEGADEHKDGTAATASVLLNIEKSFDHNLSIFDTRVKKYKGTSFSYYNSAFSEGKFDLIYVDGSHYSDDVVVDAIKCFEMLKIGGLMIFDDYFWKYYSMEIDNPAGSINSFLRLKRHQLKIIGFDYQLIIKKTAHSARWSNQV